MDIKSAVICICIGLSIGTLVIIAQAKTSSVPHSYITVKIIEVGGHRFAVADGTGRPAICEVTDASLVTTNK